MTEKRDLTPQELRAINSLKRLAKRWPKTLSLFSWSGSLCVMDAESPIGEAAILATIQGIQNDGGDPDPERNMP